MRKIFLYLLSTLSSGVVFMGISVAQNLPTGAEAGRIDGRFKQAPTAQSKPRQLRGLESTVAPAQAAQISLRLDSLNVIGSTIYSQDQLLEHYKNLLGKDVTLAQIFEVATKITAEYGKDGYLLSRVIVPPQELSQTGAKINLQVVEGYVDDVIWPEGLSRYRNFFDDYATKITSQRPLRAQYLERYLLLASDLPGLKFRSNMQASDTNAGASRLVLTVDENRSELSLSVDNHGTEASGPYQATLSGALNNTFGFHERWNGGYTTVGPSSASSGQELHYFFWGYDQTINSEGLKLSISGNASWGNPGSAILSALDYETKGFNLSTAISVPFIRTRAENLTGTIAFDLKNSKSTNSGGIASLDRLRIIRGELSYDKADEHNGTNQLIFSLSHGIAGLGSTENNNINASRTLGKVDFFKSTVFASRTQNLKNNFSLYVSAFGQWTPNALLSSQECGYGGQQNGRGFDASVIVGDRCLLLSAELRHNASLSGNAQKVLDSAQFYNFIDYGNVWNIDAPLGTPEQDHASSAGTGVRLGKNKWNADFSITHTLTEPTSTTNQDDWRVWARVGTKF